MPYGYFNILTDMKVRHGSAMFIPPHSMVVKNKIRKARRERSRRRKHR